MRKLMFLAMLVVFASVLPVVAMEKGKCMKADMMKAGCMKDGQMMHGICCMPATEMKVENKKDGVIIKITSKDAETVKKLQEAAAEMQKCASENGKKETETANAGDEIVTCPVMGEKMPMSKAFAVKEYKGKKYYMCCAQCSEAFDKDPAKYAK